MSRSARIRTGVAVAIAFVCGLLFASSFDWTKHLGAQAGLRLAPGGGPPVDVGGGFHTIAERITPAVVSIQTQRDPRRNAPRTRGRVPPGFEDFFRQFEQQQQEPIQADGSGFLVSSDGYILTNNHVVGDADKVTVTLTDHRTFDAKVVGGDPTTDVAVIKIDGRAFPTVVLGEDTTTRVGDWVVAVGNPLGLDFTVTAGIVSAKGRGGQDLPGLLGGNYSISDFIQTDAAINPGNSGGPLINTRGEVIGINSAIASRTGFYSGYGFAIPISLARDVMEDLIKHGRVRAPVLGVIIREVRPEDAKVAGLSRIQGVFVQGFSPSEGSPAEKAGIQAGDVVTTIDGRPVDRVSTLQRVVRTREPGDAVALEVMRFGKKETFRVSLTDRPEGETVARAPRAPEAVRPRLEGVKLGITVEAVSPEFAREASLETADRGVRVVEVSRSGPAARELAPGSDVITDVLYPARRKVRSVSELQALLQGLRTGDVVSLRVVGTQEPYLGARVASVRHARGGARTRTPRGTSS
ncbi:MAG TPA: Do family serine endopeptidase [Gemmatirosa sp.]|nr:Do family serine endopeptidase [Gemmatirosa sp.]